MANFSRSRKMVRKPRVAKKRIVNRKKTVRRVSKKPAVTTALATVAVQHNKMLRALFDSNYYEYKRCTEMEVNRGYHNIYLDTVSALSKVLPMHVYDLTSIVTDSLAPSAFWECRFNSLDYPFFQPVDSLTFIGANNGSGFNVAQSVNRSIQDYFDLKVELFARSTKRTHWNLMLLKVFDEEMLPKENADSSAGKHNNFWKQLVRPFYTNTFIPSDSRIMADLKGKYKILWQKDYSFKDKDSSFDEVQRKTVKIFKKLNQLNTYNENPEQKNYTDDNPNTVFQATAAGTTGVRTSCNKRIFLVIRASATQDLNVGTNTWDAGATTPDAIDIPSYNVYLRTKHTIPANRE